MYIFAIVLINTKLKLQNCCILTQSWYLNTDPKKLGNQHFKDHIFIRQSNYWIVNKYLLILLFDLL